MESKKVVRLTNYDLEWLQNKARKRQEEFHLTNEQATLVFEMYKLELRVKYLAQIMQVWTIDDPRIKRIASQVNQLVSQPFWDGLSLCEHRLDKSGLAARFRITNNPTQYLVLQITDSEFNAHVQGKK